MRARRPPPCRIFRRLVPVGVVLLLATPLLAFGQELAGRVSRGPEGKGVAGVEVQLHRVTADSGAVIDSARTDHDGRFRLRLAASDSVEAVYLASARHDGVLYFGAPLHGGAPPPPEYPIVVFDTMLVSAPTDLEVAMRHVILTPIDGEAIETEEILDVAGPTDHTVVGSAPNVPAWTEHLPEGAHGPELLPGGLTGDEAFLSGGTIGVTARIPPAGVRLVLRYVVPGSEYRLSPLRRTQRLEMIVVGKGVEVEARGVAASPAGGAGEGMRRFSGRNIRAGAEVYVKVRASHASATWGWVWLAGGLLLAGAAAVSWRLTRLPGHRAE